jgi:hypothetical protein
MTKEAETKEVASSIREIVIDKRRERSSVALDDAWMYRGSLLMRRM